ncbi:hypothetical protein ACFSMW_06820 [Virgibacillus halophilus]|uniref:Uncharacterized protein n=1 Tax=Tigheibacillus halophilus TaxID=361280 RepID=A0ABU5C5Y7_9BACI|nr:hypothetical protein [Virgibacillus halophilus]
MNYTKLNLFFSNCGADITLENNGDDQVIICISEMAKNESKSSIDNEVIEPVSTTEIYLGAEEAHALLNALNYIVPRDVF